MKWRIKPILQPKPETLTYLSRNRQPQTAAFWTRRFMKAGEDLFVRQGFVFTCVFYDKTIGVKLYVDAASGMIMPYCITDQITQQYFGKVMAGRNMLIGEVMVYR